MRHISASELQEWIEFFTVEGFESDKQELRNVKAILMITSALGYKPENPQSLIRDPWNDANAEVQTQDELIANLEFLRVMIGERTQ